MATDNIAEAPNVSGIAISCIRVRNFRCLREVCDGPRLTASASWRNSGIVIVFMAASYLAENPDLSSTFSLPRQVGQGKVGFTGVTHTHRSRKLRCRSVDSGSARSSDTVVAIKTCCRGNTARALPTTNGADGASDSELPRAPSASGPWRRRGTSLASTGRATSRAIARQLRHRAARDS